MELPSGVVLGEEELGMTISQLVEQEDVGDYISDILSNKYGYCLFNFTFVVKEGYVAVSNIEWDTTE